MAGTVLSPFGHEATVDLSRTVFRKQVLPVGAINYKGRRIEFNKQYLADLANSFKTGAFDQVPFVLADSDNRHNMDPERFRGEVKGLEVTDTGLDAIIEFASEEAAKTVRENPRLGVSARIIEGMERADGKSFGRAIQHVLGTMDPRVNGLAPWRQVALSGYDGIGQVVDLTAATYEGETDVANLTEEEVASLRALLPALQQLDLSNDSDETPDDEDDEPTGLESLSDEELETVLNGGDLPADQPVAEPVTTSLSEEERYAIDLANQRADFANEQVYRMALDLAEARWQNESVDYLRDGVPPAILDLAQPLLALPEDQVVDLSNGESVNASEVVRNILAQVRVLDLSTERGHSYGTGAKADPTDSILDEWDRQAPIHGV